MSTRQKLNSTRFSNTYHLEYHYIFKNNECLKEFWSIFIISQVSYQNRNISHIRTCRHMCLQMEVRVPSHTVESLEKCTVHTPKKRVDSFETVELCKDVVCSPREPEPHFDNYTCLYVHTHMHVHTNTHIFTFPYCLLILPTQFSTRPCRIM